MTAPVALPDRVPPALPLSCVIREPRSEFCGRTAVVVAQEYAMLAVSIDDRLVWFDHRQVEFL